MIGHLQRRVVQRFGVVPPGAGILQHRSAQAANGEPDQRGLEVRRILTNPATHQVWLARQIAEIVVKSAGARDSVQFTISSIDFKRSRSSVILRISAKRASQPAAIVQRHVDHVQIRAALGSIALYRGTLNCMRML